MKRICYLGSAQSPHNKKWLNYLKCKYDITVISFEDAHIAGVDIIKIPRVFNNSLDYVFKASKVLSLIDDLDPDLIHAHRVSSYGFLGSLYKRTNSKIPYILSVWGEDIFAFPKKSVFHKNLTKYILNFPDQICSTSNIMKSEIEKYHDPRNEILVTPFGINSNKFKAKPEIKETKSNKVVIGTVKKLRKRYGVDYLIKAFAQLEKTDQYDNLELMIVGGGPKKEELIKLSKELNIQKKVKFVGRVSPEEVPDYLNKFDVYCALSINDSESFGVAIIEASAVELPVVVTNVGGLPEVVKNNKTGFIVPPKNHKAAFRAIKKLVDNKDLRIKMGREGRKYAEDKYEWKDNAMLMSDLYDSYLKV